MEITKTKAFDDKRKRNGQIAFLQKLIAQKTIRIDIQ